MISFMHTTHYLMGLFGCSSYRTVCLLAPALSNMTLYSSGGDRAVMCKAPLESVFSVLVILILIVTVTTIIVPLERAPLLQLLGLLPTRTGTKIDQPAPAPALCHAPQR